MKAIDMKGGRGQEVKGKKQNDVDVYDKIYLKLIQTLCLMLIVSPITNAYTSIEYDRYLDVLSILFLAVRAVELRRRSFSRSHFLGFVFVSFVFIGGAVVNYIYGPLFNGKLALIDLKIYMFIIIAYLFVNRRIGDGELRKKISSVLLASFVVSIIIFIVLNGGRARLKLLDESNYMMLDLFIVTIIVIDTYKLTALSRAWTLAIGILAVAAIYAQSRTGFTMIAVLVPLMLLREGRYWVLFAFIIVGILLAGAAGDQLVELLTRNQTQADKIDRVIFLQEVSAYWDRSSWREVLIGNHVGRYISESALYMGWWSERMSTQQNIPFGLAPFNLHSMYLRILTDVGVLPAIGVLYFIYSIMKRSVNIYICVALFMSAISMSVFYLSAVIPFIVIAQLLRPDLVDDRSEERVANYGRGGARRMA